MESRYGIFFTGVCSTPSTVGIVNWATGEKISEISCDRPTGEATRAAYEKYSTLLKIKYGNTLTKLS